MSNTVSTKENTFLSGSCSQFFWEIWEDGYDEGEPNNIKKYSYVTKIQILFDVVLFHHYPRRSFCCSYILIKINKTICVSTLMGKRGRTKKDVHSFCSIFWRYFVFCFPLYSHYSIADDLSSCSFSTVSLICMMCMHLSLT